MRHTFTPSKFGFLSDFGIRHSDFQSIGFPISPADNITLQGQNRTKPMPFADELRERFAAAWFAMGQHDCGLEVAK
jgi:hypothetical protein